MLELSLAFLSQKRQELEYKRLAVHLGTSSLPLKLPFCSLEGKTYDGFEVSQWSRGYWLAEGIKQRGLASDDPKNVRFPRPALQTFTMAA